MITTGAAIETVAVRADATPPTLTVEGDYGRPTPTVGEGAKAGAVAGVDATGQAVAEALEEDPRVLLFAPVMLPIVTACAIVFIFFGGFGAWAAFAPLDSAAIAPGHVTVAGNRKTVQHLEGGIIEQLLVKEDDELEANQVLIRLDDTQPRATLELLRGRHDTFLQG